eukprot:m.201099 g.201099  ORF g.201099 m.201099 type:complete len:469 (+) comp32790_c1_seq1:83-1489(+)
MGGNAKRKTNVPKIRPAKAKPVVAAVVDDSTDEEVENGSSEDEEDEEDDSYESEEEPHQAEQAQTLNSESVPQNIDEEEEEDDDDEEEEDDEDEDDEDVEEESDLENEIEPQNNSNENDVGDSEEGDDDEDDNDAEEEDDQVEEDDDEDEDSEPEEEVVFAESYVDTRTGFEPGEIKNKLKRREAHRQQLNQKRKAQRDARAKRKREIEELGDKAPKSKEQKTLDNTREVDGTVVESDDDEVAADQDTDELASYFNGKTPKVIVTTSDKPVGETFKFAEALINIFPSGEFIPRKGVDLKKIIKGAIARDYTDIIVVNEDRKVPTALVVIHLPDGPTAHFKLSSIKYSKQIKGHGRQTSHHPEVILNNFHTRLGHQVGRMINALFPQNPQFVGRSAVTFHNQRDFIFFRFHRYLFKNEKKVGLQELGPRFTLKLRSLQKGTFDSKYGEYEWIMKRGKNEMDTSRRRFFL